MDICIQKGVPLIHKGVPPMEGSTSYGYLEQASVGFAPGARGIRPWKPWDSPLTWSRKTAEANPTVPKI